MGAVASVLVAMLGLICVTWMILGYLRETRGDDAEALTEAAHSVEHANVALKAALADLDALKGAVRKLEIADKERERGLRR